MLGLATRCCICTMLKNVPPFWRMRLASRDKYMYSAVPNGGIGVCLYIGETNFAFPRMLYESECHQRWVPRGSDTSMCPRLWLGPVGDLCQALEARKKFGGKNNKKNKNMKRWKRGNSDYDAFPSGELQFEFGNIVALRTLK